MSISARSVRPHGIYTTPRTYGVYEVPGSDASGRSFRFGNHPIRQRELVRDYGRATLVELFTERALAVELARLLNNL
jgi:hypothetical protein